MQKILTSRNLVGYVDAKYLQTLPSMPEPETKVTASLLPRTKPVREGIRVRRSEFGFEISHIKYAESSVSMQEKGIMGGASGSYAFRPGKNMFRLEGRFSLGSVDYSSPSGEFSNISDYSLETRFVFGRDIRSEKIAFHAVYRHWI